MKVATLIFLVGAACTRALSVVRLQVPPKTTTTPEVLDRTIFETSNWKSIQRDLNRAPVFSVVDSNRSPLISKNLKRPMFYCDIDDALRVLEEVKSSSANADAAERFKVATFPLGKVFELWHCDKAMIVPSRESLVQAGGSSTTKQLGQQVPLFGCLEITEHTKDGGKGKVPLFMSLSDAKVGIKKSVKTSGEYPEDFEIICLSLSGAVEHLITYPDSTGFHFIPPKKSQDYVAAYLQQ